MKNNPRILDAPAPSFLASVPTNEPPVGFTKSTAPRKASKLHLYSSKPAKLIAVTSALFMIGSAAASTISVDFHGVTQTTTLTAADIAGVVPTTTWNAALGNNNFAGTPVDAPTLVGAATVDWTSTGSANTSPNSLATPDHQMMEGYLTGSTNADGTTSPASVRVTGLNLSGLGWTSYDLYVFSDTSKNGPSVLIDLYTPSITSFTHTELIIGTYAPPTFSYVDSQTSPAGNYVVFTGLTATNFNFEATPLSSINEAAINGFQLVGNTVPEPSTGLLALLSISALVLRRCR
jgi:hypothetical protein